MTKARAKAGKKQTAQNKWRPQVAAAEKVAHNTDVDVDIDKGMNSKTDIRMNIEPY